MRKGSRAKAKTKEDKNQIAMFDGGKKPRASKTSKKASLVVPVVKALYGGLTIEELVEKFRDLANECGGGYKPSEWNGSGEISFNVLLFEAVEVAIKRIDDLSKKYEFTCVFKVQMFKDVSHEFRYAVTISVPGVLGNFCAIQSQQ